MELDTVPDHLLVLGGGYIGLEFGQLFRRFGSRVTIIQSAGQLLTREDTDIAEEVARILQEDGVEVIWHAKALRVGQSNGLRAARPVDIQIQDNAHRICTRRWPAAFD